MSSLEETHLQQTGMETALLCEPLGRVAHDHTQLPGQLFCGRVCAGTLSHPIRWDCPQTSQGSLVDALGKKPCEKSLRCWGVLGVIQKHANIPLASWLLGRSTDELEERSLNEEVLR